MDWANEAVKGIIKQLDFNDNWLGCQKCSKFDICKVNDLFCTSAIEGILKDDNWKPMYKRS